MENIVNILKGKKVIFFDVGYTLDYPASGDWILINKFWELITKHNNKLTKFEVQKAKEQELPFLLENHLILDEEAEYAQFTELYYRVSQKLGLVLSEDEIKQIAHERTYNMNNYIAYSDAAEVLEKLSKTYKLGIISDTWPSIEHQLESLGLRKYFSFVTYSCNLGVFKPDEKMYLDAIAKSGVRAEETVFIDDSVVNLQGAAKCGITPILIAANPESDIETEYIKIHSLSELLI